MGAWATGAGKAAGENAPAPMHAVCSQTCASRVSVPVASIATALLHTLQGQVTTVADAT